MVIHTFRQPEANEPVDTQRLTSSSAPFVNQGGSEPVDAQRLTLSSAPFVIQGQRVRWQAEIPYGYPHLSLTKANEFDGIGMMLVVRF